MATGVGQKVPPGVWRPLLKSPNIFVKRKTYNLLSLSLSLCSIHRVRPALWRPQPSHRWTLARRHLLLDNICCCYSLFSQHAEGHAASPEGSPLCGHYCQFHHCLQIMPWGYKTPPEASSAAPMIYSYLWPIAGFDQPIWVETTEGLSSNCHKKLIRTWRKTKFRRLE